MCTYKGPLMLHGSLADTVAQILHEWHGGLKQSEAPGITYKPEDYRRKQRMQIRMTCGKHSPESISEGREECDKRLRVIAISSQNEVPFKSQA